MVNFYLSRKLIFLKDNEDKKEKKMKRILALILCLAMMLSMVACAGGETTTETVTQDAAGETKEENKNDKEETKYPKIEDLSTKDKLAAIPIAKQGMSEDELRKICVDYFRLQLSFTWTPSKNIESKDLYFNREVGTIYAGLPYVSIASGNLYRAMEWYDPATGIIDVDAGAGNLQFFGLACSGGVGWAWGRVINSADYSWTQAMTQKNGFINVGPFTYDPNVEEFDYALSTDPNKFTCENVVKANGPDVMYESYALMKPADGLVNPGHVRMNMEKPVVVRDPVTNKIDGKASYTYYCDQANINDGEVFKRTQSDGTEYRTQGGVDIKVSFEQLFNSKYIPVTFKEFLGQDPVEAATVSLSYTAPSITAGDLIQSTVTSNYAISDIFFTVKDASGKELKKVVRRMENFFTEEVLLSDAKIIGSPAFTSLFEGYAKAGTNTVEITCQLSTGELLTAYTGTLIV